MPTHKGRSFQLRISVQLPTVLQVKSQSGDFKGNPSPGGYRSFVITSCYLYKSPFCFRGQFTFCIIPRLINLARREGHWNRCRSANMQNGCSLGWPGGGPSFHKVWHHHLQVCVSGVSHGLEGCASACNGILTEPACFGVPLRSQPLLIYWSV